MNGWSRSSPRPSSRVAASASVRATMMPGTPMTSSWKRAALRRLICSSDRDQHLAALVAALLGARPLVLDVVAGHAGLDEAADQVAHVGSPPWPVSASAMMKGR
jgi:hypothetical protein